MADAPDSETPAPVMQGVQAWRNARRENSVIDTIAREIEEAATATTKANPQLDTKPGYSRRR